MYLTSNLNMPVEGSEFTVEMGYGMPMPVYVKGTDMDEKGSWSLVGLWDREKPALLSFRGISMRNLMLLKYCTPRLFNFCEGHGPGTLQQDNAHPRTAGLTANNIGVLIGLHCPRNKSN